jgi:hypothetical protein
VNQELLLQNEYLAAKNRILRAKLTSTLRLGDPERATLAEIGKRLGRKALLQVACIAKPDTILAWYRRLVAQKFDGSKHRKFPGRPRVAADVEALVLRMAKENTDWGYDRIVGALSNLGHPVSDQTVATFCAATGSLRLQAKSNHLVEGLYRCSQECAGECRLLHRGSAHLAGAGDLLCVVLPSSGKSSSQCGGDHQTPGPREWMEQIARSATQDSWGYLDGCRYVLHDRDTKILRIISVGARARRRGNNRAASQKSESECLC